MKLYMILRPSCRGVRPNQIDSLRGTWLDSAATIFWVSTANLVEPDSASHPRNSTGGTLGTYDKNPSDIVGVMEIVMPFSSTARVMSKTWSTEARLINSAARAKWRPGQILWSMVSQRRQHQPRLVFVPSPISKRERCRVTKANIDLAAANKTFWAKDVRVREHRGIM